MRRDEEQEYISHLLNSHKVEYNRLQAALKNAAYERQVKARQRMDQDRRLLLGTDQEALDRRKRITTEAQLVEAAKGTTESLRRTRQMITEVGFPLISSPPPPLPFFLLCPPFSHRNSCCFYTVFSQEIEHTSTTLAAMETSHAQLAKTRNEYAGQHAILRRSRGLLRTLNWQNRSETMLLWLGLLLFILTSAYVGHKRLIFFVPEPLRPVSLIRSTARMFLQSKVFNETSKIAFQSRDSRALDSSPPEGRNGIDDSPPSEFNFKDNAPEFTNDMKAPQSAPQSNELGTGALVDDVRMDL